MVKVIRKEGESTSSLVYRFSRRIQQSGLIKDVKKSRFSKRKPNKTKIKKSALHRLAKQREVERRKKLGLL